MQPSSRPNAKPQTSRHGSTPQKSNRKCFQCGRSPHPRAECPASQAVCHKCKKKGLFSSVCQSKSVGTVEEEPDTCYLNTVYTAGDKSWTSHVKINGQTKPFKLDTGSEVTAISLETFQSIHGRKLSQPNKTLCGLDRKPLKVLGTNEVKLSIGKASCKQHIYVLEKLKSNLLGLTAIVALKLLPKRSGDIHICVDLKPLNESVLREVHPLPKVDDTLAQLAGAVVFSKLHDANSRFWQIPLAKTSGHLTTFIISFGRYCFNKMPYVISSAPEHFQKRMSKILSGLDGVLCQMDDILSHRCSQEEHDRRLVVALKRIQSSGVTLNPVKWSHTES